MILPYTITHIYLDMDGVLADFDRGIRELCHMKPVDQDKSTEEQNDALWTAVRQVPHFYDRLEPIPGAVEMFQKLRDKYGDRVQILTGIPKPRRHIENSGEDKIKWVRRLLSEDVPVHIVYREEKLRYCKGPRDILIDDYAKNIREWRKEPQNGTGILFESSKKILKIFKID